jgi:hypothetical protein
MYIRAGKPVFFSDEVLTVSDGPDYIRLHTRAVLPLAALGFTLGSLCSQTWGKIRFGESHGCVAASRQRVGKRWFGHRVL